MTEKKVNKRTKWSEKTDPKLPTSKLDLDKLMKIPVSENMSRLTYHIKEACKKCDLNGTIKVTICPGCPYEESMKCKECPIPIHPQYDILRTKREEKK